MQMKVNYVEEVESGRSHHLIGRIQAAANWRSAESPVTEADRLAVVRALMREAESYDADAIVEVRFEVDSVRSADIGATTLHRITATGIAVRYDEAA
jgi:uncharacterized protein YbjQ (UPF0145 family)